MNSLRNISAVMFGILLGGLLNLGIIMVGPSIVPLPDGVDLQNMETFAENLRLLRPVNFFFPWLAHALGTLVGAIVAAKLSAGRPFVVGMIVASIFLLGGIVMIVGYGGPVWFAVLDLGLAYLPMGYLGAHISSHGKREVL